jgi:hypothetical protein
MDTLESRTARTQTQYPGLWIGVVEDRNDPERLGRLRVRVKQIHGANSAAIPTASLPWASRINLGGSLPSGVRWVPPLGTQVAVMFFHADPRYPFWLGTIEGYGDVPATYSGRDPGPAGNNGVKYPTFPGSNPSKNTATAPLVHTFETPRGHRIVLDDNDQSPDVVLESSQGQLLVMDDHPNRRRIEIQTKSGCNVLLDDGPTGYPRIEVTSPNGARIQINDDPNQQRIHAQTKSGHFLDLNDTGKKVLMQTIPSSASGDVVALLLDPDGAAAGSNLAHAKLSSGAKGGELAVDLDQYTDMLRGTTQDPATAFYVQGKHGPTGIPGATITTSNGATIFLGGNNREVRIDATNGKISLTAAGQMDIHAEQALNITSNAQIRIQAPSVQLN